MLFMKRGAELIDETGHLVELARWEIKVRGGQDDLNERTAESLQE